MSRIVLLLCVVLGRVAAQTPTATLVGAVADPADSWLPGHYEIASAKGSL